MSKVCTGSSIPHGVDLEKSLHEILQGRSPLKFFHPKRKGMSSNHHFSGAVLVCGGVWGCIKNSGIMWYFNGPLGVKTVKSSHFIIISGSVRGYPSYGSSGGTTIWDNPHILMLYPSQEILEIFPAHFWRDWPSVWFEISWRNLGVLVGTMHGYSWDICIPCPQKMGTPVY